MGGKKDKKIRKKAAEKSKHTFFRHLFSLVFFFPIPAAGSCISMLNGNKAFLVNSLSNVEHKTPGAVLTTEFATVFSVLQQPVLEKRAIPADTNNNCQRNANRTIK